MTVGDAIGDAARRVPVYSTVLRVRVTTPVKERAFEQADSAISAWLVEIFARNGMDVSQGLTTCIRDGQIAYEWHHPDRKRSGHIWYGQALLQRTPEGAASFDVRFRVCHPYGEDLEPFRASVLATLAANPGILDAGRAVVPFVTTLCTPQEVGGLCELIDDERRTLPVVLVSEPLPFDPAAFLQAFQKQLIGLAHVMLLPQSLSWEITERYGKEHGVYNGAVRYYPAGALVTASAREARRWLPDVLRRADSADAATGVIRRWMLADVTAFFEREPLLTVAQLTAQPSAPARAAADISATPAPQPLPESPTRSVEDVLGELAATREELEQARAESARFRREANDNLNEWMVAQATLEEQARRIDELRAGKGLLSDDLEPGDRELLRVQIDALLALRTRLLEEARLRAESEALKRDYEQQRRMLERALARERTAAAASAQTSVTLDPPADWRNPEQLASWITILSGGQVVLHPRVARRLQDGDLPDPEALFQILQIICCDLAAMQRGDAGARDRFYERVRPYKSGPAITQTGSGRVRDEYTCDFDGHTYGPEDHQHIRERGTDFQGRHACVYYVPLDDGRILITSMPKHLETANDFT